MANLHDHMAHYHKHMAHYHNQVASYNGLYWYEGAGCCSILTSHMLMLMSHDLMVMSHEVMETSHVLMLISHVYVCLHMLMRFHYKLEWGNYLLLGIMFFSMVRDTHTIPLPT